jgi:glyoxylase-like metal-dependent hydrolase (beta-lactamase superfamily II)
MNSKPHSPRAAEAGALVYPFDSKPGPGEVMEVAPGVMWIRMKLPFHLDHINLWAIADEGGWTVVDCGIRDEETAERWTRIFENGFAGRPVVRVIVTHMHPDHVGMAGWITRRFGCRLWMTRGEYLSCRVLVADTGREAPTEGVTFYRRAGWSDTQLERYRTRFGGFGKAIYTLPDGYRRLQDGDRLTIGQYQWEIVVGSGHSPEHACLVNHDLGILISGDQVLPRISSNVSVFPTEPDANPLADWMASIERLKQRVSGDVLVLPAHNEPFHGLVERLDGLQDSHERSLESLENALAEPRRAVDTFPALFSREIRPDDGNLVSMATGESLAHLNWLVQAGRARADIDSSGVAWYRKLT